MSQYVNGSFYINGGGFQNDVLASYPLFGGRVQAKTLLTVDHSQYWKYNPTKQLPNAVLNNPANAPVRQSIRAFPDSPIGRRCFPYCARPETISKTPPAASRR